MAIIVTIAIILIIYNKNENVVYIEDNGVKYSILINGNTATSFPSGNYKVSVTCDNAVGYWDSIQNKVIINDIVDDILCNVAFNSITNSDMLNNYIIGLSNTTQGTGAVVHEMGEIPSSSAGWEKASMTYENVSGNPISVSNNEYTGTQTTANSSGYYKFYPPTDGYYRVCYSIPSSATTTQNKFMVYYLNNTSYYSFDVSSSVNNGAVVSDCVEYGIMQTTDFAYVQNKFYDQNITFYFEKATNMDTIDTGYRYEGKNPNNYIWFNNELWRIVGVFETEYDSNNDGIVDSTDNLVKIVRNRSLGSLVTSTGTGGITSTNDYANSTIRLLLNDTYYNHKNDSTYCYGLRDQIQKVCDYRLKGIQTDYQELVMNAKWYLGGGGKFGYTAIIPDNIYSYERDQNSLRDTYNLPPLTLSILSKVALLYESDFLYATLETSCPRKIVGKLYNTYSCGGSNWMASEGRQLLLTMNHSDGANTRDISESGGVSNNMCYFPNNIRPTIYLSPSVYRVSGTGTITDPYIIGMAS